jgi:hypothetical protein
VTNPATIRAWIFRRAPRARASGKEIQFPCPACGHSAHYFNPHKGVGYCHAARCQKVSTTRSLEELWGEMGDYVVEASEPDEAPVQVILPAGCQPLVTMDRGQYVTRFPEAVQAIQEKRFLTPEDMFMFAMQLDTEEDRIVIPIISEEGELVNYVSRSVWWYQGKTEFKRYMYAKGADTGSYLFNYRALPKNGHVAIVENTFNAIWLRRYFPCTSAFGSHLSNMQVAKLKLFQRITLFWDRGAEDRARAACEKLRNNGLLADFVEFVGPGKQPDDYTAGALSKAYAESGSKMSFKWSGGVRVG